METAKQGYDTGLVADERKFDQVVDELNRYRVSVAALQETKWFGDEMYKVGDSIVLTSLVDQCRDLITVDTGVKVLLSFYVDPQLCMAGWWLSVKGLEFKTHLCFSECWQ